MFGSCHVHRIGNTALLATPLRQAEGCVRQRGVSGRGVCQAEGSGVHMYTHNYTTNLVCTTTQLPTTHLVCTTTQLPTTHLVCTTTQLPTTHLVCTTTQLPTTQLIPILLYTAHSGGGGQGPPPPPPPSPMPCSH